MKHAISRVESAKVDRSRIKSKRGRKPFSHRKSEADAGHQSRVEKIGQTDLTWAGIAQEAGQLQERMEWIGWE